MPGDVLCYQIVFTSLQTITAISQCLETGWENKNENRITNKSDKLTYLHSVSVVIYFVKNISKALIYCLCQISAHMVDIGKHGIYCLIGICLLMFLESLPSTFIRDFIYETYLTIHSSSMLYFLSKYALPGRTKARALLRLRQCNAIFGDALMLKFDTTV